MVKEMDNVTAAFSSSSLFRVSLPSQPTQCQQLKVVWFESYLSFNSSNLSQLSPKHALNE
jgi:hypothetical protein